MQPDPPETNRLQTPSLDKYPDGNHEQDGPDKAGEDIQRRTEKRLGFSFLTHQYKNTQSFGIGQETVYLCLLLTFDSSDDR